MDSATLNQDFAQYPTQKDHERAWEELACKIAATRDQITEMPDQWTGLDAACNAPQTTGELTIIGSGIETVGFTTQDEKLIQTADKVFYCVADPATVVWLKSLRPDAYDLYVLYDDTKVRYVTYMQMTEALLYYVRQGKKVLGIYYGHPGIFVLSSHRAIKIARREGYRAKMRAGISALDTLCADLGVDPSQPGMQTFEATDMLVRSRIPDTSLHVVLWQVGLVGELGYRRSGYINSNFSVLIEYLQKYYGKDYPITNYIGSRYPGVEPTTDIYTLQQLHDPMIQSKVTGISTFYLAPQKAAIANLEMMERLGMIKPGTIAAKSETLLRQIDQYSDREMVAFSHFENFKVPKGYHWQEDTAAARFILALREDVNLCETYLKEPQVAVSEPNFSGLSDQEKVMLLSQDAGSMQLAAKGLKSQRSMNAVLIHDILCQKPLAKSLRRTMNQVHRSVLSTALEKWSIEQGYSADWSSMRVDFEALARRQLYPWSGAYLSHHPQVMIFILGSKLRSQQDRVYVNGTMIRNLRFQHGRMQWSVAGGNSHNGYVHVDVSPYGGRRLAGVIWPDGAEVPAHHNFVAPEVNPNPFNLCQFVGDYEFNGESISIQLVPHVDRGSQIAVYRNGNLVDRAVKIDGSGLRIADLLIPFQAIQSTSAIPEALRTQYRVRSINSTSRSMHQFDLTDGHLKIDGQAVAEQTWSHHQLTWSGGPGHFNVGELGLLVDPISLLPMSYGTAGCDRTHQPIQLTGMKPASEADELRAQFPTFDLPLWAWQPLLAIAHDASHKGGLFLWNTWERHTFTHRVLQNVLSKVRSL